MDVNKSALARPNQLLEHHLIGVGTKASLFSKKINLPELGNLLGLLHDVGKYSDAFQHYLASALGEIDPDNENYSDPKRQKGKIDHATAGAQWVWKELSRYGQHGEGRLCGQILAVCIASHHSGLIDCLCFKKRIEKPDDKTHLLESLEKIDAIILDKITSLANKDLVSKMIDKIKDITKTKQHGQILSDEIKAFYIGLLTRFLFSCLIDADRIDSARPNEKFQLKNVDWNIAITRFEMRLSQLRSNHDIDRIRREISDNCRQKASGNQGIYTLTVPTGGGKTYASLRFALHHAKQHQLNHIIYIIPYTSIIEQNAQAIRAMIEQDNDANNWVLEIHSNLEPEKQSWHSKITAENWDAPIILTTMVQFLEVLFSDGTRSARRLHQLAHSVLIFDEIQTLPIKCVHLFCNALNFLTEHTKTTALLCTATQPLLDNLTNQHKGQLFIPQENELIEHVAQRFSQLKRVDIRDERKAKGWCAQEIIELALLELRSKNNCLIVVNTKSWAKTLYQLCKPHLPADALFHMSTNQCAAHRTECFARIKHRLNQQLPILCISTQLIEAGVDISFATVIRFLAGFDSIAQAAGRCNRHGELQQRGVVYVINPNEEHIDSLPEIRVGCEMAQRVLDETKEHHRELLTPATIARYFTYYFYHRAAKMDYPLESLQTTLFDLLAANKNSILKTPIDGKWPLLRQSFMSAGKLFEVIDAPTQPIIVPYQRGRDLIAELCGIYKKFDQEKYFNLLRSAQRYTVNVFSNTWKKLIDEEAVHQIQDEGIYHLDERYYSAECGLATTAVTKMSLYHV